MASSNEYYRNHRIETRNLVIERYGGRCQCGEEELPFLTLKDKKGIVKQGYHTYHAASQAYNPERFQVQCWNCKLIEQRMATVRHKRLRGLSPDFYLFLKEYGKKCACCGETNPYTLTLDHIHGDGFEERRYFDGKAIYKWAIREKDHERYQVLCASCNFAKGHNRTICPHKSSH